MRMKFYFSIFIVTLFAAGLQAQVIINEFSASNYTGVQDNFGETEDWVELYNAGANTVNLEGYWLSDNIDNPLKWTFPGGVSIDPGEQLLIFLSDRDLVAGGTVHAGFKLTQAKQEWIVLTDPSEVLLDAIQLTNPTQVDHSRGRVTDGDASWGIFVNPSAGGSNGNAFEEYATKPVLSLEAGFYTGSVTVGMTAGADEDIYYTTDGSEPTQSSTQYVNPITVSEVQVVKARAYSTNAVVPPSFTEANTYFVDVTHTIPVVSVAGTDLAELFAGQQFDPIGSFELFGEDQQLWDEAYGDYNKHGNDSWAYPQRGVDYITRDAMGYTSSLNADIFPTRDRGRYQRLMIKAAANDNYPFEDGAHIRDGYVHMLSQYADMEMDERTWEPCILYLNGEYWGVYELREKVDDPDYTNKYFNQGEKWLDFLKTWGGTWEEYGSRAEWDNLHDFITNNSMADQTNYDQAASELNMTSLVDYMILNTHVVCKDWLNWNTAWWRGNNPEGEAQKWRYALWDMDASFGHYINYTSIPNDSPQADPCDNEVLPPNSDPEGHVDLITSLLESDDFHSLYVNRYADMNNSFLSCDYMIFLLDSMISRIQPEMQGQIDRWGGNYAEWEGNVQELRDFILSRCEFIDTGIVDCYDVEGPYGVTVNIVPDDSPNAVKVNTFVPQVYPFEGDYFGGTTLSFEAVPDPEWELDHWEVDTNSFNPDQFAQLIDLQLANNGEVITAFFRPVVPCAPPLDLAITPTLSTIELEWSELGNALSYEVNWRETDSMEDWGVVSVIDPSYTILGLELCTDYDVRVRSICENALGEYLEEEIKTGCINGTENLEAGIAEINIFPNPFREKVSIDFILGSANRVEMSVFNVSGKVVAAQNLGQLGVGQHVIAIGNAAEWESGVYFVQILTEEGMVTRRVVKH
ncbi:MAG: hypothetical protein ACI9XO_001257 [Paraglaciecola sp.]|jgi:hypothetical protein